MYLFLHPIQIPYLRLYIFRWSGSCFPQQLHHVTLCRTGLLRTAVCSAGLHLGPSAWPAPRSCFTVELIMLKVQDPTQAQASFKELCISLDLYFCLYPEEVSQELVRIVSATTFPSDHLLSTPSSIKKPQGQYQSMVGVNGGIRGRSIWRGDSLSPCSELATYCVL